MSRKITVTLDPDVQGVGPEEANLAGWVSYYQTNPTYIGKVPTPGVSPPDGQTKVVLDNQTALRYYEIAAQFEAPPSVGKPSVPDVLTVPGVATAWLELQPGEIGVTVAGFAGKTSASCQDNVPCFISTESTFPDDPNKTSWGAQATNYILVSAGQPYYYKTSSGSPEFMRTSIELV